MTAVLRWQHKPDSVTRVTGDDMQVAVENRLTCGSSVRQIESDTLAAEPGVAQRLCYALADKKHLAAILWLQPFQ